MSKFIDLINRKNMEINNRRFLPTPTRSVHASTIEFWNDHPVFAWFGGSREGSEDVAIYLHNLNDEEKTITLGNRDGFPRWNPILYKHDDTLFMFEKIGAFCDRWQTFVHDITDWDENTTEKEKRATAQVIPAGLNGPVKTRPVEVMSEDGECEDNRLVVCGSAVETFFDWTSYFEYYQIEDGEWKFVKRSKPLEVKQKVSYRNPFNGRTQNSLGIIQPAMWTEDNNIHSFFRSSGGLDHVFYYDNESSGDPVPTNMNNPNSGVDVAEVGDRLFIVMNPSPIERVPLVVREIERFSENGFKTVNEIEIRSKIDDDDTCISRELSYPYMVEHNGQLHLVYTYGRSKIEYVVIDV
jgi:predicted neuraminidase